MYKHGRFLGLDIRIFKNTASVINISQVYFLAEKRAEQKVIIRPYAVVRSRLSDQQLVFY